MSAANETGRCRRRGDGCLSIVVLVVLSFPFLIQFGLLTQVAKDRYVVHVRMCKLLRDAWAAVGLTAYWNLGEQEKGLGY